jgi:hypothetical protein
VGEGTSRTVREIEEARERLAGDLDELAGRIPRIQEAGAAAVAKSKRALIPTAGAAAGGLVVWLMDRKRKKRRAAREAEALAAAADDWMAPLRDGRWVAPATVVVGIWGVLRFAEARSVRRLSKALVRAHALEAEALSKAQDKASKRSGR